VALHWHRAVLIASTTATLAASGDAHSQSLRFFGNGTAAPTLDRVVIALDAPARPVDVGASDATVEFWMRALPGENTSSQTCSAEGDRWILGNIVIDRDTDGPGDFGDYGLSLMNRRLAFGVSIAGVGATVCGSRIVDDGQWHHVAATRRAADGALRLFVDGAPDGTAIGPAGDASYRDGRSGATWDPYLVLGAEKHDYEGFASYAGWLAQLRVSSVLRYQQGFARPGAPWPADAQTVALYRFDEGDGNVVGDSSGAAGGPSTGERRPGGNPEGPQWSASSPFDAVFANGFDAGSATAVPSLR
jgi:hypothetical protein